LLEQAKKRFTLEGIGFPLPQTTVAFKHDRNSNCKQEQDTKPLGTTTAERTKL
jgi:hypothetical protein